MIHRLTITTLAITTVVIAAATPPPDQKAAAAPTLLVVVVVDQLRTDYLTRQATLFRGGLKRLLQEGAVFDRAAYPYLSTVTCAGHATIATGAFPATHGMINNEWWSREDRRRVLCTDDPSVSSVPYAGAPETASHSARRLRIPTLGDRMREANRGAQSVALSIKPRSAVTLAGKYGTAVTWYVDSTHGWATSTAYAAAPVPEVHAFVNANPIDRDRAQVWTPLDAKSFSGTDADPFERPKIGWTASFPHPLGGIPGTPEHQFYELWKCSPFSDAYLAEMAVSHVRSLRLGQRDAVDLLSIGFSGLDCVGHDFGPDSAEVHDMVQRLDRTLGVLFDALDATVGREKYAVALSSDHGVSAIPERLQSRGIDAGRVFSPHVRNVAEDAMVAAYGAGPHIASVLAPNIYFSPTTLARVHKSPELARPAIDAVSKIDGVRRVFEGRTLASKRTSPDMIERAAALSYHASESGDLVFALKPHWITGDSSAASHGTSHAYDQQVPLVFMGARFKPGRYTIAATPGDLAPTLASLIGIKMSGIDGRVLTSALR